jgi:hypothetical protein
MLKNLCKSTKFYYDTRDRINPSLPPLILRGGKEGGVMKAGWPNIRPIRSCWQAFFSTSALSTMEI